MVEFKLNSLEARKRDETNSMSKIFFFIPSVFMEKSKEMWYDCKLDDNRTVNVDNCLYMYKIEIDGKTNQ